jgi:hypothetical protein
VPGSRKNNFSFIRVFLTYTKAEEQWRKLPPLLLLRTIRGAVGNQRKDVRCQQVRGRARQDLEGMHLILHQGLIVPGPEQL